MYRKAAPCCAAQAPACSRAVPAHQSPPACQGLGSAWMAAAGCRELALFPGGVTKHPGP